MGLRALIELDDTLAAVLRGGGEAMLMQMRLVWWRDALIALDAKPAPAVPMLVEAERLLLPASVSGAALAELASGWEIVLTDLDLAEAALLSFARQRGGALFSAAAKLVSVEVSQEAGQGWALVDLARHVTDRAIAERAVSLARPMLAQAIKHRLPARGRALSALTLLAAMDAGVPLDQPIPHGAPGRVMRLAWHRMSGR